ncbi:branched-chain amino acid ABC transporter permease [Thalassovita taeanensis]|uniref:Amino acid/amide ABC transporter membrane protein 2, HAAT family n=1 Tax=Thalassovita taeanensis TaxID=657014 RepID=A0A1H9AJE9_9RHOB|nr:branched-chain amino acid ABC transporter permease [Thalassovita taeanensis]SEP76902.1 amino acid/amide ABC transporter membrane protein 2, HAAT family [Thalassovita taeanensis]
MTETQKILVLHVGLIALLFALNFILPAYHHGNLARVMVLATYAIGYNVMLGYTGLLSLGHAMFFAAGMYGMALSIRHLGFAPAPALLVGIASGAGLALVVGLLALRTAGVAFMIVTLMFAQTVYLTILLAGRWTRGDEGFVIQQHERVLWGIDLSDPSSRYLAALTLFAICLFATLNLIRRPLGRVFVAIRENEERARLLGYNVFRAKLFSVVISGTISAAAGASYGLLFGYAGATFATVQYSIFPLLWVLLGGTGTIIGPFLGALFMFYLIDLSSGVTNAYMLIAGVALVVLVMFAPQGIAGELRRRIWSWLP